MSELRRTIVSLTPDQHEWLRQAAFNKRVSMAALLRQLVDQARATSDGGLVRAGD